MKNLLIFTIITLCFTNAFGQIKDAAKEPSAMTREQNKEESKVAASSKITDEEYAIYIAIFSKSNSGFVIRDKSGFYDFYKKSDIFLVENFERLKPGTIRDFRSKNEGSFQLEKKLPTKNSYSLVGASEVDKFFTEGLNWEEFGKKYPKSGGFFIVSRAGFSKDNNQALVFVARFCGTTCGAGDYHFLIKTDGEWKLIKTKVAWVV